MKCTRLHFSINILHCITDEYRAFPVAGAPVWIALPSFVNDSATVATFKRHLKTYLFARSLS